MSAAPSPGDDVTTAVRLGPFRVDVTRRRAAPSPVAAARLARAVVAALEAGAAPSPASIGVILSDDAELAGLNEVHMGHEGPTDVLSFPLLPPAAFPPHEGRAEATAQAAPGLDAAAFPRPPGVRLHLGDVVVSLERAAEQAERGRGGQTGDVRWSVEQELLLLVVHGTLHVCGWDHAERAEEATMRRLEMEILSRQGTAG